MKIILDIEAETKEEIREAQRYAAKIQDAIERRKYQGFPGMCMSHSLETVWVKGITIDGAI